jgi:hypothetical protein
MKALMVIDGRTISPFGIKSITSHGGCRRRWCSHNEAKKLWHPMIETYIRRLPWWKRGVVRNTFPNAVHYHQSYVQVRLRDHWHNIRIECNTVRERDEMLIKLRSEWDQAMTKFHGTGCNFGLKDK